jgi:hypothetical protein
LLTISTMHPLAITNLLLVSCMSAGLLAQSVVVPNSSATVGGTGGTNTLLRNAGQPRTYQQGINASQLTGIPAGSVITGVSLRFSSSASNPVSWPPADISWTAYDIFMGPANPTASWVGDPALNFAAPPQQVRGGGVVIDAGTFADIATVPTPNPFGEFYFDFQNPFPYAGGDLAILFSHPGSTDTANPPFPESVASSAATHGVSRSQSVYPSTSATAMLAASFYVMRIHYGYGAGCAGATGTPVLVHNANTTGGAGGNLRLTLVNTPPGSLCLFALGFTQLSVPLGGGCTLLTSPDVLLAALSDTKGRAVHNIPVPPAVTGSFFAQGGVLDPTAPGGISVSNGVSPSAQ